MSLVLGNCVGHLHNEVVSHQISLNPFDLLKNHLSIIIWGKQVNPLNQLIFHKIVSGVHGDRPVN